MQKIIYKKRESEIYGENPPLYKTDTPLPLSEYSFPLNTDTFKVLEFGREPKEGCKYALVEYTKKCGHKVNERIRFEEDVKDFEHYGTKFTGASYLLS